MNNHEEGDTFREYRLLHDRHLKKKKKMYIQQDRKIIKKMNKEVRMLLPKKDLKQVEYIGKINNYYEDIYIPPYNNTD